MGQPRRAVTYANGLHVINVWVSVSAFLLGVSMLVFLYNFVKSLEWQVPTPVPVHNFDEIPTIDSDPYDYGIPQPAGGKPAEEPAAAS